MTRRSIHQQDRIPNVYASNNRASKHIRQKLIELNGETNSSFKFLCQQLMEQIESKDTADFKNIIKQT